MISINDLSDEQKDAIRQWAADGAGLDEIHTRIRDEFELRLTYMDARFLVADLEIEFEDDEEEEDVEPIVAEESLPAAEPEVPASPEAPPVPAEDLAGLMPEGENAADQAMPNVTVSISDIAAPGAMASGTVDFGNGETGIWTVDQMGRLGLNPTNKDYQPTEIEIMAFQEELHRAVESRGY